MLEMMDVVLDRRVAVMLVRHDRVGEYYDKRQQAEAERYCLVSTHPHKYSEYSGFFRKFVQLVSGKK